MNRFLKLNISALFPNRCAYCGKMIPGDRLICSKCPDVLPRIKEPCCLKCGREKAVCSCRQHEKYYEAIVSPFYFKGVVRKGIHEFKFRNSPCFSEAYAVEMAETVREKLPDVQFNLVTGVPLSKKSLKSRGYEQSALLASHIADILNIEFCPGLISKIYETEPQHGKNFFLRYGNLTGVFDVTNPELVKDKTVLLCDDVSTSGETLNECAKMLWLADAKAVYCVTLAVTENKKAKNGGEKS